MNTPSELNTPHESDTSLARLHSRGIRVGKKLMRDRIGVMLYGVVALSLSISILWGEPNTLIPLTLATLAFLLEKMAQQFRRREAEAIITQLLLHKEMEALPVLLNLMETGLLYKKSLRIEFGEALGSLLLQVEPKNRDLINSHHHARLSLLLRRLLHPDALTTNFAESLRSPTFLFGLIHVMGQIGGEQDLRLLVQIASSPFPPIEEKEQMEAIQQAIAALRTSIEANKERGTLLRSSQAPLEIEKLLRPAQSEAEPTNQLLRVMEEERQI
jgi:hypothetical protein